MVTGGLTTGNKRLDSTEVYRNNAWSVLPSAALPSPTSSLSAGKIDDTIFLLGTSNLHTDNFFYYKRKAIQVVNQPVESYGLTLQLRGGKMTEDYKDTVLLCR